MPKFSGSINVSGLLFSFHHLDKCNDVGSLMALTFFLLLVWYSKLGALGMLRFSKSAKNCLNYFKARILADKRLSRGQLFFYNPSKWSGSLDRLGCCGPVLIDLGLHKGHGWFLNILGAPLNFLFLPVKANTSLLYNVSGLFKAAPTIHKWSVVDL